MTTNDLSGVGHSWLLVFDNVDGADLNLYWPPSSHGSIIVTTQRKNMAYQASSEIHLDAFEEKEGSSLILDLIDPFRQHTSATDVETAKAISNELGGLPLLLSHVAGFLNGSRCRLTDLLTSLQQPTAFKKIWAWDSTTSTNFQYGEPMAKVWKLALHALKPEALTTLQIMAFLSPEGIYEEILLGEWEDPNLKFLCPKRIFE